MIDNESKLDVRITPNKYEEIERCVVDLYAEQGVHCLPIDPFSIIKNRGHLLIPFYLFDELQVIDD